MKNLECFTSPQGQVMIVDKNCIRHLENNAECRQFIHDMAEYIRSSYAKAYAALHLQYEKSELNSDFHEFQIVNRFCKCNFAEYDTLQSDVDTDGRFHFEEVRCPLRGECPLENVCCKPEYTTDLSSREKEILELIVENKTAQEISAALFISVHTVNNHRRHILQKTKTANIPELINFYHTTL